MENLMTIAAAGIIGLVVVMVKVNLTLCGNRYGRRSR